VVERASLATASGGVPPKAGKTGVFEIMNPMYKTYILKSEKVDRYYIGHAKDLEARMKRHNTCKARSTKAYAPWKVVYCEEYLTKNEAYRREKQIKSYKKGEAFNKLITER